MKYRLQTGFCYQELSLQCQKSSMYREIQAFEDFYSSPEAEQFRGSNLVHFTDNMNCERNLLIGSKNIKLHPKVLKIFLCWKVLDLKVMVCFITRDDPRIEFTAIETRNIDLSDYGLDFENMAFLMRTFGPFNIDCFASQFNKKCSLYFFKLAASNALWNQLLFSKCEFRKSVGFSSSAFDFGDSSLSMGKSGYMGTQTWNSP